VNGETVPAVVEKGYLHLIRMWKPGDQIQLDLAMPVTRVYAHPLLGTNQGKVALNRGPLIYCLEEDDNCKNLYSLRLPRNAEFETQFEPDLLNGIVTLTTNGLRLNEPPDTTGQSGIRSSLYSFTPPVTESIKLKAIPYYAWDNRDLGNMLVWIHAGEEPLPQ
jgi:DUF1680 family protein